jgi:hypothetical protein
MGLATGILSPIVVFALIGLVLEFRGGLSAKMSLLLASVPVGVG